jgi:hypothetical protein
VPRTLLARTDESKAGEGLVTMKLPRPSKFLHWAAGAAALPVLGRKAIRRGGARIVIGFPAGVVANRPSPASPADADIKTRTYFAHHIETQNDEGENIVGRG